MNRNDPTDIRAKERSRLGLPREVESLRTNHEVEQKAGSKGIPLWKRWRIIEFAVEFSVAAASRKYEVSKASIWRWMERAEPYQQTGNYERRLLH